jgi:septal ring factor EnvC (AmiA/AmiB activator)
MPIGLLAFMSEVSASPSAASSDGHTALIVALIAAVPGIWGAYTGYKARQDAKKRADGRESLDLSKLGADILRDEVTRLTEERERWEKEREVFSNDRAEWLSTRRELTTKITDLSQRLEKTNEKLERTDEYLRVVTDLLYQNGIAVPARLGQ